LLLAALVGVGVALLEPELIPGVLIGAGAMLAPKVLPALRGMVRPMIKGVKAGYSAAATEPKLAAEAREQVEDWWWRRAPNGMAISLPRRSIAPNTITNPARRPSRQQLICENSAGCFGSA